MTVSFFAWFSMLWSNVLDLVRGGLFVLAHWCGGSVGGAILVASSVVRIALLPLTLRAARRAIERQRALAALAPHIERINKRYAEEPARLVAETRKLYAAHGISWFDRRAVLEGIVQMPPAIALYSAIRGVAAKAGGFLWVADLTKPDRWLAASAAAVSAAVAWISMSSPDGRATAQLMPILVTGGITLFVLSHLSAGIALYSIANSVVGGAERQIALRTRPRP